MYGLLTTLFALGAEGGVPVSNLNSERYQPLVLCTLNRMFKVLTSEKVLGVCSVTNEDEMVLSSPNTLVLLRCTVTIHSNHNLPTKLVLH